MKPKLAARHPHLGLAIIMIAAISVISYLLELPRQWAVEHRAAGQLLHCWKFFDAMHPGEQPTNVIQLFAEAGRKYPYPLHEKFRIFGRNAGFEHSLAEKYIILRPPVPDRGGEIVLLSTQPYPNKAHMERIGISKLGEDQYRYWSTREDLIQSVFRDANRTIPAATPMPRPPPPDEPYGTAEPFWVGIAIEFAKLEWKGVSPKAIPTIRTLVLSAALLGVCAFLAWCFWPVTRVESLGLFFEEPTDKQKVVHVRIWTALATVLTVLLILKPAGGGESELPYYIILPYGMMAIINKIPGLAFFCAIFQFPIYGWIIAHTWRNNELTLGVMIVTLTHSGAMLLSALMAISN